MTRRWTTIAVALTALASSGCTNRSLSPEPLPVDRVECARCRMLISTASGGGQIVSRVDDTRFYDDLGCLAADWPSHREQARAYVRLADGSWIDAQTASYARPANVRTPMGSGLAAFASAAEATRADRDGHALGWDDAVGSAGGPR